MAKEPETKGRAAEAPARAAATSAIDLVELPNGRPPDADAARDVLDDVAAAREEPGAGAGAAAASESPDVGARGRSRRARLGERRSRKGGHKATKTELEAEVRQLRDQLAQVSPGEVELITQQIAQLQPALSATFAAVFSMVAKSRGEHWRLADDERALLAQAWAPCLAPYMDYAGAAVPWIGAAAVTWSVVEGRVEQDQHRGRVIAAPSAA